MGSTTAAAPLPSKTADSAVTDKARQLYQEGVVAYKKEHWPEARAALLAAWNLHRDWRIAGNLADTEIQLERYRDAAEHAAYYLHNAPSDRRERAESLLKKAQAKVGTLTVTASPPGAEVLLDDAPIGRAPLPGPVFVAPGKRILKARYAGRPDSVQVIDVTAGMASAVKLDIAPTAAPPLPPPPPPPPPRALWPIAVGGGATAALLASGIAFVVLSDGRYDDMMSLNATIEQTHGHCAAPGPIDARCYEIVSAAKDRDAWNRVAIGAFVAAGVLAAGTLTYALWPASKANTQVMNVYGAPVLGAGYGGLMLNGSF